MIPPVSFPSLVSLLCGPRSQSDLSKSENSQSEPHKDKNAASWGVLLDELAEADEKLVTGWMNELQNTLTFVRSTCTATWRIGSRWCRPASFLRS